MTEFDEPEEPSWLHDLDWVEVNKLRRANKDGGDDALEKAWKDLLEEDVLQFARVACAYAPDSMPRRRQDISAADGLWNVRTKSVHKHEWRTI